MTLVHEVIHYPVTTTWSKTFNPNHMLDTVRCLSIPQLTVCLVTALDTSVFSRIPSVEITIKALRQKWRHVEVFTLL